MFNCGIEITPNHAKGGAVPRWYFNELELKFI